MLVVLMKLKYKFSYGNSIKYVISQIMIFILNIFGIVFLNLSIFSLFYCIYSLFNWKNKKIFFVNEFIGLILFASFFTLSLCMIIQFLPKCVILNDDSVKIKRHYLNPNYYIRGFNDKILIKKIVECKKYNGYRYRLDRSLPYAVYYFNWDDLVEINTENEKRYLIPIKNSDDFIKQVNLRMERIKFLEKYNLNSVIAARGISPEQIKFRWKSQDELESVYYIDYQGNKVDIPFPNNKSE